MMARTKQKDTSNSPGVSSVISNRIHTRQTASSQTNSKRKLYSDDDDDDDNSSSDSSKTVVDENDKNKIYPNNGKSYLSNNDPPLLELTVNKPPSKKHKAALETSDDAVSLCNSSQKTVKSKENGKNNTIPDTIGSAERNDDAVSSIMPLTVSSSRFEDNETNLPQPTKTLIVSLIRNQIFRRIKFVSNEKLSFDSSICKQLFNSIGFHDKKAQVAKYEILRHLVLRQMNAKRNYCIDQILSKARELMKKKLMFDVNEMNHFYDKDYFRNNSTRQAWYVFCYKFLTCVNSDWLKSIHSANAKNQVNMFRYITVSDEALVRWTLEIKTDKLLAEEKNGWQEKNGGKKPNGMHDSRQFSPQYAKIHQQVKESRSCQAAEEWNNLFWSMYKHIHPKFFEDRSSIGNSKQQGIGMMPHPDEDDYDPGNEATTETKVFAINDGEDNNDQIKVLAEIL